MMKNMLGLILAILLSFLISSQAALAQEVSHVVKMIDSHHHIYKASSELSSVALGLGKYGTHNLFDDDKKTAWDYRKKVGRFSIVFNYSIKSRMLNE